MQNEHHFFTLASIQDLIILNEAMTLSLVLQTYEKNYHVTLMSARTVTHYIFAQMDFLQKSCSYNALAITIALHMYLCKIKV